MANASKFWGRVQEEVRSVSERTRLGAARAVRSGVLSVDLVSLRSDRNRAQAHLGDRVLTLWSRDALDSLAEDAEALRLRALVKTIEERIAAKEAELAAIRTGAVPGAAEQSSSDGPSPQQ